MGNDEDVVKSDLHSSPAETERLAALGKFTARIAHELNNPLDGILRYINLANRCIEQNNTERLKHYLDYSQQGLLRMAQVISEVLEFSRSQHRPPEEPVPLECPIEDAIKAVLNQNDAPPVEILRNYSNDLPKFRAGNLFQVFCNLIKNACDSMDNGGTLEITTRKEPNGNIAIEFSDSGCGFDPEQAKRLFEPFFTTKTRDKGTGLGLAICKDLVQRYGGRITAHNRQQGGSVFTVYLPKPTYSEK